MARPKQIKTPARLNLVVDLKTKKEASKLAFDRGISMGRLFANLLVAEKARIDLATINGPGQ